MSSFSIHSALEQFNEHRNTLKMTTGSADLDSLIDGIQEGVLTNTKYNDKRKYPDDKLRALISHFNSPRLRNEDLEKARTIKIGTCHHLNFY
jgi:hypothetical protein